MIACAAIAVAVSRIRAEPAGCALFQPGAASATAASCRSCHASDGARNHPVDVDYEKAWRADGLSLRAPSEVVRRGVLLPEGQVRCATCHDARSPWKDRIALPPGTRPEPAVDPRDPRTYDPQLRGTVSRPRPGDAVAKKPLCLACHALD